MDWTPEGLCCERCSAVFDPWPHLRCGRDRQSGRALLQVTCPVCHRLDYREVDPSDAWQLNWQGVLPAPPVFPFELLEHHSGPPITETEASVFARQVERDWSIRELST